MKKILLTVLTILTALSLNAQPGVVFEIKESAALGREYEHRSSGMPVYLDLHITSE